MKRNNVVTKIGMKTLLSVTGSACWVFSLLLMLTACQSDETKEQGGGIRPDGTVPVKIRLSVAGQGDTSNTRADDINATSDELMNIWTVYCVDNDPTSARYGKLVFIHICMPNDDNREIDDLVYLPTGKYAFYSFANIHPIKANELMGITYDPKKLQPVNNDGTLGEEVDFDYGYYSDPTQAGTIYRDFFEISQTNQNKGKIFNMKWAGDPASDTYEFKYHDMQGNTDIGKYAALIYGTEGFIGNGLNLTEANCFDSMGIPMSNYQEIDITDETTVDLIVVRMVAKIEVQLFNESDNPVTVKSATLSDVTLDGSGQIGVFPNLNNKSDEKQHEHEMAYTHQDLKPHISDEATVGGYTYTPETAVEVPAKYKYEENKDNPAYKLVFYVNESKAPNNASGLFYLSLGIKTGSGDDVVYSHALISNTAADEWSYIARNDYRKIPIVLTDWQFRIEPIAFTPIAGYPAKMLSSDALTATFSTGGMIALQPFVKKRTETTWRDFDDSEVNPGVGTSWNESITWKNDNGSKVSGTDKIIKTPFTYDPVTKYIIGELNNDLSESKKTAVTITMKLGTAPNQYTYSFTCDVNLQK